MNQYSDIITDEWFLEYKNATNIRKIEIEEEMFSILRKVNEFPLDTYDEFSAMQNLRTLSTLNIDNVYKNGCISRSSIGNSLCYNFYPNIWDVKKMYDDKLSISIRDAFYDDKLLKKMIRFSLKYTDSINDFKSGFRLLKVGYCMNFRPVAAKIIYDTNLKPNSKVLDYAAGYGGRLLGAWAANNVYEYIALEPNTETFNNAGRFDTFLNKYFPNLKTIIYKVCSEDFNVQKYSQYKEYFDMAFSSPQYFDLEIYSEEKTQSANKFPEYSLWVKGFLKPTINNCIDMLKPDGIFAINISDETDRKLLNISKIVKLLCYEKNFIHYKTDLMELTIRPGNGSRDRMKKKYEPIWYFKKK